MILLIKLLRFIVYLIVVIVLSDVLWWILLCEIICVIGLICLRIDCM